MFEEIALPFERGEEGNAAPASSDPAADEAHDAALRDAQAIAARVAADEQAADTERDRLIRESLPALPTAANMAMPLLPGEVLHAERPAAIVERGRDQPPSGGTLYLTSGRIVHVGTGPILEVDLQRINDMAVSMERLLLIELADGSDLAIEVDQPRLLRVQLAAARAVAREGAQ
jgi:hypothetical protein